MKKICVIGLGYIGLPTAVLLAEKEITVLGVDIDEKRVNAFNRGEASIEEPEIKPRLAQVFKTGRLYAFKNPQPADVFVIAVPTPIQKDKTADLSCVWASIEALIPVLQEGNTIILESTVPVGTTQKIASIITENTGFVIGSDLFIAFCPERVLPGNIFYELVYNDRVVGGITLHCAQKAQEFYQLFVQGNISISTAPVAEMVKLVENSSRDVSIAFAHEVARMAESASLNAYDIIELANKHPRVNIMNPTCGVGGHCIAVDPWFLVETFPQETSLIKAARLINDERPRKVLNHIAFSIQEEIKQIGRPLVTLLCGLSYKANIDDLRESPALDIVQGLFKILSDDVKLLICDPYIKNEFIHNAIPAAQIVTLQEGIALADTIVFLVGHKEFACLDIAQLRDKLILDYCGMWHRSTYEAEQLMKLHHIRFKKYGRVDHETSFSREGYSSDQGSV